MSKKSKVILVVEDDPILSKVLRTILVSKDFTVECAADGEDALKRILRGHYGLILLDLVMPRLGGFEVMAKMKENGNTTPVLVFTNLSQEKNKSEALRLGAKGYYVKSDMSVKEVIRLVRKFLK